ncbi:MAG: GNAT family N-acetyltransferase [Chitinophagales bacterium]
MTTYKFTKNIPKPQILNLYTDAGWIAYTKDEEKLMRAIENSRDVFTAWEDENLVGLIRIVGDGETIIYIQDILVLQVYKRKGISTFLLKNVLDKYSDVRQIVLLTDDTEETRGFYEAINFASCDKGGLVAFMKK